MITDVPKLAKTKINQVDPSAEVYLFGSRARNDYRIDSDWDLLILTEKEVDQMLKNLITDQLFEIELEIGQGLSSIVQNKKEWQKLIDTPFYQNISKESIRI
jgi:uncharacterized protein